MSPHCSQGSLRKQKKSCDMSLPGLIGICKGARPNTNWTGSWIIRPHEDGQGDKVITVKHTCTKKARHRTSGVFQLLIGKENVNI